MFEIGFPELILIAIVGLLVIGPERLPEALRTLGLWVGRMRRSFTNVKTEIEKEIGMDEIRRQLHNEAVMEEMKRIERDVRDSVNRGNSSSAGSNRPTNADGTIADATEPASEDSPGTDPLQPPASEASEADEPTAEPPPARPGDDQPSTTADDDRRHG